MLRRAAVAHLACSYDESSGCFLSLPLLRSVFFSFEGIDGSGKSTQVHLLADALRSEGHEVVVVREPGGTPLGEQVRSLLLDSEADIDPRSELLLFSAARAQLVSHVVRPALDQGAVVIADRFFDSSTAYQGAGRELETANWFSTFHSFVTGGVVPDRTYLVDVNPRLALSRRGTKADRLEAASDSFFARVQQGYRQIARSQPERVLIVDGSATPEEVHAQIILDALGYLRA